MLIIHVGCAFLQLTVSYYSGQVTDYGMDGWLAVTPIGSHFDLEATGVDAPDVSLSNIPGFFTLFFDLGDTVNGFAVFKYGFLDQITEENLFYVIILGLRVVSVVVWIVVGGALIQMVLTSGLLGSRVGLIVLFGGIGILSVLGIAT